MTIWDKLFFWRKKVAKKRSLKAASTKRLYANWVTGSEAPNANITQLSIVRARANELYNNDPFIRGAVDLLVNRIVGPGSVLQARSKNPQWNVAIESLFNEWSKVADVHEQYHFGDLERLCIQSIYLNGGIFFKKIIDTSRAYPFCLEPLEYYRLATDVIGNGRGNTQIINGIEVDITTGEPLAYYFYTGNYETYNYSNAKRIPAKYILHFSPFRLPGQLLGIPLLAPAIPFAYHLTEAIEAELITKKVEACFGVFITSNDIYGRMQDTTVDSDSGSDNERIKEIYPGMIEHLSPAEDIKVIDPRRPGKSFLDFASFILGGMARSLGLSLEQITGDKSKVNYSSTRHSEMELRDYFQTFRRSLQRYFLDPIWDEFVKFAIVSGQVKAPAYLQHKEDYHSHEWIFKGSEWIDPEKEAKAKAMELEMNITTLAEICAQKGKDWQQVLEQRLREKEFIKKLEKGDLAKLIAISGGNDDQGQ